MTSTPLDGTPSDDASSVEEARGYTTDHMIRWCVGHALASGDWRLMLNVAEEALGSIEPDDDSAPRRGKSGAAKRGAPAGPRQRREAMMRTAPRPTGKFPALTVAMERNLEFAREGLRLDEVSIRLLHFFLPCSFGHPRLRNLCNEAHSALGQVTSRTLACLMGEDEGEVLAAISKTGRLSTTGLVEFEQEGEDILFARYGAISISPAVCAAMRRPSPTREEWNGALVGKPMQGDLGVGDFGHLGRQVDLLVRLLRGAAEKRSTGINIMLHGPAGTGKTEFARAVVEAAGMTAYAVGEADNEGGEPTREERLAALRTSVTLLSGDPSAAVVFDEAEDGLGRPQDFGSNRNMVSKVFVNRILESNPVPVIWPCNSIESMDPAVLRRMNMIIEMRRPDRSTRQRVWTRAAAQEGMSEQLDDRAAHALSARWDAPPAVAAAALRNALLAGGGVADIETSLGGTLNALGLSAPPPSDGSQFDPALSIADVDLALTADKLSRTGAPRAWSMLVSGPAGTGKSAYARYLAHRLEVEVMQKRASDLVSKYVGETEKLIAAAFQEARARGCMLIIDEFDAMGFDRRAANHTWEISQVAEILTWLESHSAPVVCTTNLIGNLDPAMLRRFTIKIGMLALDAERCRAAFLHYFGRGAPADWRPPTSLTPGDFKAVRDRAMALDSMDDTATLVGLLEAEAGWKSDGRVPPGFRL